MTSQRRMVSASSSRFWGKLAPMALRCVPGESQRPSTTGFGGGGGGDDDVVVADGLFGGCDGGDGNAEFRGHVCGEFFAALLVAAEDVDAFDFANVGDGFELGAGLQAGADDAEGFGIFAREQAGGVAAGGSGAHLADVVGFDLGEEFAGFDAEKEDQETQAAFGAGVDFQAHVAADGIGGGHVMKIAFAGEMQAGARVEESGAIGEAVERIFDGFQGERHGEDGFHIGFGKEEGHWVMPPRGGAD